MLNAEEETLGRGSVIEEREKSSHGNFFTISKTCLVQGKY